MICEALRGKRNAPREVRKLKDEIRDAKRQLRAIQRNWLNAPYIAINCKNSLELYK